MRLTARFIAVVAALCGIASVATACGNDVATEPSKDSDPVVVEINFSGSSVDPHGDQIDVPVGQELHVTDLGIQNLSRDSGIATVRKGDEIIQQWDLSRVLDNIDIASFRTGLVFEGGSQLVFEIDCDAPGTSGGCADGLLVTGRLVTTG